MQKVFVERDKIFFKDKEEIGAFSNVFDNAIFNQNYAFNNMIDKNNLIDIVT